MDAADIQSLIGNPHITVTRLRDHAKASESYADVLFSYPGERSWNGSIPYHYRRIGIFYEKPEEIAAFIEHAYGLLDKKKRNAWVAHETALWNRDYSGKSVTKPFFDKLVNLHWNSVESDLPSNPNWAKRVQEIKDMGYFLATDTHYHNARLGKKGTHIMLIPLPRGQQIGYETMSPAFKKRVIKVLGNYEAYDGKVMPAQYLIPDHKFPEISWDPSIPQKNEASMTDAEIRSKFQLLTNQHNLQKREACRKIYQTRAIGTLFGIDHYIGPKQWPSRIPRTGRASEAGWRLTPWYDIEAWRQSVNKKLKNR